MPTLPHAFVRRTRTCCACPAKVPPSVEFCAACLERFPMLRKLQSEQPRAATMMPNVLRFLSQPRRCCSNCRAPLSGIGPKCSSCLAWARLRDSLLEFRRMVQR